MASADLTNLTRHQGRWSTVGFCDRCAEIYSYEYLGCKERWGPLGFSEASGSWVQLLRTAKTHVALSENLVIIPKSNELSSFPLFKLLFGGYIPLTDVDGKVD